jgi:hypothetical protein
MRKDRLAAMEAFVLVVDLGSFSAAARRLDVGQPAISKLVAQLDGSRRLGVAPDRSPGGTSGWPNCEHQGAHVYNVRRASDVWCTERLKGLARVPSVTKGALSR